MQKNKGQDLNHLLNFHYQERPKVKVERRRTRYAVYNEPYDKKKYISANFRFVLNAESIIQHNTDVMGAAENWESVVCVLVHSDEQIQCPVCLDDVKIPRVTNCGHVFCLVCLLRYIESFSGFQYARCPICFEDLEERDLRPAVCTLETVPKYNTPVSFDLLTYTKGDVCPRLVGEDNLLFHGAPLAGSRLALFSRVAVATPQFVTEFLYNNLGELDMVENEAVCYEDHACAAFIPKVKKLLEDSIIHWNKKRFDISSHLQIVPLPHELLPQLNVIVHPESDTQITHNGLQVGQTVMFYQQTSGQYVFIHPFNEKCLFHQAMGNCDLLPAKVTGKMLESFDDVFTTGFRKKHANLYHVPLMANISLYEVDLPAKYLGKETHQAFKEEMKRRKKQRTARYHKNRPKKQPRSKSNSSAKSSAPTSKSTTSTATATAKTENPASPPAQINSFASIVTNNGHYPDLQAATSPDFPPVTMASSSWETIGAATSAPSTGSVPSLRLAGATWAANAPAAPRAMSNAGSWQLSDAISQALTAGEEQVQEDAVVESRNSHQQMTSLLDTASGKSFAQAIAKKNKKMSVFSNSSKRTYR